MIRYKGFECDTVEEAVSLMRALNNEPTRFKVEAGHFIFVDGWIPWNGGDCPVDPDETVEVRIRKGLIAKFRASYLDWKHAKHFPDVDIVAYRVVK